MIGSSSPPTCGNALRNSARKAFISVSVSQAPSSSCGTVSRPTEAAASVVAMLSLLMQETGLSLDDIEFELELVIVLVDGVFVNFGFFLRGDLVFFLFGGWWTFGALA
jgi:hypothetical protein